MNAAEKTVSQLVEEDFAVRVVILPGGLDPDRFVQEHGVPEYTSQSAMQCATRTISLSVRNQWQRRPSSHAEAKVKALNFLLPHIRRIPSAIVRNRICDERCTEAWN